RRAMYPRLVSAQPCAPRGAQNPIACSDKHIYAFFSKVDHDGTGCTNAQIGNVPRVSMAGEESALQLVLTADPALWAIVHLSLLVSLAGVLLAAAIGVPAGAFLALTRFLGREATIVILNALMGLPPVVVGLAIFLLLSRSGPLGSWGLLFTPQAMVIAQ